MMPKELDKPIKSVYNFYMARFGKFISKEEFYNAGM